MKINTRKYSKQFYTRDVIISGIEDYKKLSIIELSEDEEYYFCFFNSCIIDPERIMLEFDNYLIELLNSH